jgi:L-threonylcarbamoyladenylate synthase
MSADRPQIIRVDPESPSADALAPAAEALRGGGLVAFATETVYGLGANALDEAAVGRIFAAKGRPPTNPLIVHVGSVEQARQIVSNWSPLADRLVEVFWPGPLTLVMPKSPDVPDVVTAGLATVAVRMPDHAVALELLRQAGVPLAAPSANRYTEVSPTRAEHVLDSLGDAVDVIVDAGPTRVGIESTVLSLAEAQVTILRPGMITRAEIATIAPDVVYAEPLQVADQHARQSPGLSRKHYAPEAEVSAVDDLGAAVEKWGADPKVGWMLLGELRDDIKGPALALGPEPSAYASQLYRALRDLDARGCSRIVVARPPADEAWRAIRDRLNRAAR